MGGDEHYGKAVHTARHAWLQTKAVYPIMALVGLGMTLSVLSMSKYLFASTHTAVNRHKMNVWMKEPNWVWPIGNNVQKAAPTIPQLPESEGL